jgi:Ca2+-binding EF-hand superfamily protein
MDMNADGNVTKSEMTKALDKLGIAPQDILSLLRIAGFRPGINTVSIQFFVNVVTTWESRKAELISKLFTKLKAKFSGKPLEDLFEMMDINRDGTINFSELADACNMLKLNINREDRHAIFAVLDEDHSGSISLEELKAHIEAAGEEISVKEEEHEELSGEEMLNEEEDELNDKDEDIDDASLQGDFEPDSVGESHLSKTQTKTQTKIQTKTQTKTPEDSVEIDDKQEIPIVRTKQPTFPAPIKSPPRAPIQAPAKPVLKEQPAPAPIQSVKTLYGRLSLQIVKARDLPEGKYAVQCTLPGSDGPQRTEFIQSSNPEWKFRGRFKLEGIKSNAASEAVKVELFGASGVDATVQIPWLKCLNQPGNWAVNSEFQLKDKGNKPKGYILIQLKWLPRDTVRLEGSGDLYILPLSGIDLRSCIVLFTLSGKTVKTAASGPPWTETLCLRDIKLAITRAIPPLSVIILDFKTQQEVIKSSFNWESVLAAPNTMSQEIKMSLSSTMSLVLKMKWRPFTEEEERVIKCATKIQAWWRGKKAREQVKTLKTSSKKLLSRRGVTADGKFYLVNVTKDEEGKTVADLHPVGDPSIPMYTLLDSLEINPEQAAEVTAGIGDKLTFGLSRPGSLEPQMRGDLGVKVTGAVGLDGVMLKFVIGTAFVHSLAGPPWLRPMMIQNVVTPRTATQVAITVIELSNRKEMFQRPCDFKAAFGTPNAWSPEVFVELSAACKLKIQFQWLPYPEEAKVAEAAATKLQAVWKGKQARSITASTTRTRKSTLARQGLKSENGHYYLLSYYEDGKGIGVALHQADDPGVPLYEEIDYQVVGKEPLERLQARVKVAADGKLIL